MGFMLVYPSRAQCTGGGDYAPATPASRACVCCLRAAIAANSVGSTNSGMSLAVWLAIVVLLCPVRSPCSAIAAATPSRERSILWRRSTRLDSKAGPWPNLSPGPEAHESMDGERAGENASARPGRANAALIALSFHPPCRVNVSSDVSTACWMRPRAPRRKSRGHVCELGQRVVAIDAANADALGFIAMADADVAQAEEPRRSHRVTLMKDTQHASE